METIHIQEYEKSFVIHFGCKGTKINAYTLASTLVSLADAIKSANSIVNPGYEIEVVVEAIGPGSFRAKIKTVYSKLNNLWSSENLKPIVLGVIASFVYQHTLAPDNQVNVIVNDDSVIIEQNEKKIIIPREVHDALKKVEKSDNFNSKMSKVFESVKNDEEIESFGLTQKMNDHAPSVEIKRGSYPDIISSTEDSKDNRIVTENAKLLILRAILQRSKRKWEFVWRGVQISAPVLDDNFYDKFFAHKITIAPGDALSVRLRIYQKKDADTGIYTNDKYEVFEVDEHVPGAKQTSI